MSTETEPVRVTSSGIAALDSALGVGGYARGRIVELYGSRTSALSTLALRAIREAQRDGGVAAFIDAGCSFDADEARELGVDTERLLVSQPSNSEQAFEIIEMLTRSGAVDLVVVNSDVMLGDDDRGARLASQALRKLTSIADRIGVTLLFVSRLRPTVPGASLTGANALKFYASVRVNVRVDGAEACAKIVKNKLAAPFVEARL